MFHVKEHLEELLRLLKCIYDLFIQIKMKSSCLINSNSNISDSNHVANYIGNQSQCIIFTANM